MNDTVWQFPIPDPACEDAARVLAGELNIPPLVASLLVKRGLASENAIRGFLEPAFADLHDARLLTDVDKAVDRLEKAIVGGETIFVHGDYDVDGVTSAALCVRALTGLGAFVTGFVPTRDKGYDLQPYGVDKAHAIGATLILTADCGSNAHEAVDYARTLGIDVIITDHHRPGATLPHAVAIVNPYREDGNSTPPPFRELCGAGVAFKVMDALCLRVHPSAHAAFRASFVDFVALGTVADMTPLRGENRVLVAHGLHALGSGKKAGIRALLEQAGLTSKSLDADNISFSIAPKINAAGRMEDADLAFRLLLTKSDDEARVLVEELWKLWERSREESARVTREAMEDALSGDHDNRRVLVLARTGWNKGTVGVAANQVVQQCRRPVVLLSHHIESDTYHGSARTWGEFNLHGALHDCRDLLHHFGGHSAAVGLSLSGTNLPALRDKLHALAEGIVSDTPPPPVLAIDAEVPDASAITFTLTEWIHRLAPFGRDNAEPVFVTRDAMVMGTKRMGKEGLHFQMTVRLPGMGGAMRCVWFRNGDWADLLTPGDRVDVAYLPKINEWNGSATVELSLKGIRLSSATP